MKKVITKMTDAFLVFDSVIVTKEITATYISSDDNLDEETSIQKNNLLKSILLKPLQKLQTLTGAVSGCIAVVTLCS